MRYKLINNDSLDENYLLTCPIYHRKFSSIGDVLKHLNLEHKELFQFSKEEHDKHKEFFQFSKKEEYKIKRICHNCGSEIPFDSSFCCYCLHSF